MKFSSSLFKMRLKRGTVRGHESQSQSLESPFFVGIFSLLLSEQGAQITVSLFYEFRLPLNVVAEPGTADRTDIALLCL